MKVYRLEAGITRRDYAENITRREKLGSQGHARRDTVERGIAEGSNQREELGSRDTRDGTPSSGGLLKGATKERKGTAIPDVPE